MKNTQNVIFLEYFEFLSIQSSRDYSYSLQLWECSISVNQVPSFLFVDS